MNHILPNVLGFCLSVAFIAGCNNISSSTSSAASANVPAVYKKIYGATSITRDGDYIVIKTRDLPDYKTPYYKGTVYADSMYAPYSGSNPNFKLNPNRIKAQNLTFRIPVNPTMDPSHPATPYGPIGVALNGVPLFNQFAAPGDSLSAEIKTFDRYNGHPTKTGIYHYHIDPTYLTQKYGKETLIGFLLDGYPIYGPVENSKTITDSDLDKYHGHFGSTADYPNGIYHYNVTTAYPYFNGDGFYGIPGTVTNN